MSSNKDFDKLKAHWYDKLKKSGFEDVEQDEENLKVWSSDKFGPKKALVQNGGWEAKEEYYRLAGWFLNEYEFETANDKLIWELHAEGKSVYTITKALSIRAAKTNRDAGRIIIRRLQTIITKNEGDVWDIIDKLRKALHNKKPYKVNRDKVWNTVNRLETIMKSKYLAGYK